MSIKKKVPISLDGGKYDETALKEAVCDLMNGEYMIYVFDKKKNRTLSQNKYLFGVVLKMISEGTGESTGNLYKYFEREFSEPIVINVAGKEEVVYDMKRQSSSYMNSVIEKIRVWASEFLNLTIPTRDEMTSPVCRELYAGAYNEDWN